MRASSEIHRAAPTRAATLCLALLLATGACDGHRTRSARRQADPTPLGERVPSPHLAVAPEAWPVVGRQDQLVTWIRDPDNLQAAPLRQCPPLGDCVIDFPYHDALLLDDTQAAGGRVWIPAEAREHPDRYPLIVLLHGIDADGELDPPHELLSPPVDLSRPLRRLIRQGRVEPVLLAAPSQTRNAWRSQDLWTPEGFELGDFVDVVDKELAAVSRVRVDRWDVSVFAHSGAGCVVSRNRQNGIFRVAAELDSLRAHGIRLRLLGLMDICFYGASGADFLREHRGKDPVRIFGMWVEPEEWGEGLNRELGDFARTLGLTDDVPCPPYRYLECQGDARGDQLFKVNVDALRYMFAPRLSRYDWLGPHQLLTLWFMEEALHTYWGAPPPVGGRSSSARSSSTASAGMPR